MKKIVVSLGGSVIVPDKLDTSYLKEFRKLIASFIKKGYKFIIICGGGKIARDFQKKGREIKLNERGLDLLGILATRMNANLLKAIFKGMAEENIIIDPTKRIKSKKSMVIAAGWKPGWSTDYDAVLLAKNFKSNLVVNITNVDYVYNKNPEKHKDAKPIKNIAWKEFRKITGNNWKPGLNLPFDPIAAREAGKLKLKVIIAGKNLKNLKNILENKKFKGTLIR